ncbi:DEAD/DEAH box helicase [Pseudoprimorskyibacter insulae]|uniref:DEAD-box ATP-dependent RNA helicase CshA n=1 Tax=Pseudoprimorskyibacter insulae TaxID=1695997 RepID=A0A2R8B0U7_9RHOB|nr:DEAD/DEAH box helicase [Pseudoprimorskyibacter insulae]SPF81870.1 DEAD-box ATP-dependent RNA helicase CshA [Pseudoprimorskyibacter insulae]
MIQTLSDALAERGYTSLTPVQEAVSKEELAGSDLLVSAQTGSGKTVGFGLAIAPTLLDENGTFGPAESPLALIVAPTRELAMQVRRELTWLYAKANARIAACVGGMDMRTERRALEQGAHLVVGTPGRLRDHIERGSLDLSAIRAVVLDEADEMLDLGFREDLEFMLSEAPEERRTLLFSATVPPMIAKLAKNYQRDAQRISTVGEARQHTDITYQALRVAQQDAETAIVNVLRYHDAQNAIVFANTRASVSRLAARFANRGFAVVALSGELSQTERSHALQAMRDGRARVCVATDVAARGIDLPNLDLVVHAELPTNAETLLHRSGRTGRAGRKGLSALIVPPKELKKAERLLKWGKLTAEWTTAPGADDILRLDEERLLADPVWTEEITEEDAAFAGRLLEQQSAEKVATAYLKLYRARFSAPEDLADPDTAPRREPRREFGPSKWFALSVGRNDRAEARWLLPLLCRAGNLDKTAIGAIRVTDTETYVELAEPSVQGFLTAIGTERLLEDGITAREADAPPAPGPRQGGKPPRGGKRFDRDDKPKGDRPFKPKGDRDDRPKRDFGDRPAREDRPARDDKPREYKPKADRDFAPRDDRPAKPKKDRDFKPKAKRDDFNDGMPVRDDAVHRPMKARASASDTSKRMSAPGAKGDAPRKPRTPKTFGKTDGGFDRPGKPRGNDDKPRKSFGKPSGPGGKPSGFGGKPSGPGGAKRGPAGGKPGGNPGGKPGGKRPFGGDAPPRRPKY